MTNLELNRALAELVGYTVDTWENGYSMLKKDDVQDTEWLPGINSAWMYVPQYCTDPAASRLVEGTAIEINYLQYIHVLSEIRGGLNDEISGYYSPETVADLLTATPRERAEAAYITLQGAKRNV
jgi:hypothetical protein